MNKKPQLILMVGNIGSGKSTYVKKFVDKGYVCIARDQLRYGIGNGKYIFNPDYERIIWDTEKYMFQKFMDTKINLIIDEIGISKTMRMRYIQYVKELGYEITVIEMPKFCMGESVSRRLINNHGNQSDKIWNEVWTKFEAEYEAPSYDEGIDKIIKLEKKDVS